MNKLKCFIFAAILIFSGCAKDGEPGPKGDQGITGANGEKGDKGDEGAQGETGTANVMYSEWMDFDWNAADEPTFRQMTINVPEITEEFLEDGGGVYIYLKASIPGTTIMVQLPYTSGNELLRALIAIIPPGSIPSTDFSNGIVLNLESIDGTTSVSDFQDVAGGTNYDVRYILIPGGISTLSSGKYGSHKIEYESLKQMYNIPD